MGRPSVVTDEMRVIILQVIADGLSWADASVYVGLKSRTTIHDEAKRNPEFSNALKRAELDGKLYHLRRIKTGGPTWQSSAWFLERKFSGWRMKKQAELSPPPVPPVPFVIDKIRSAV